MVPKAAAFQSLSLQLGGSFSTAALITLLAQRTAFHQSVLAENITPGNTALQILQQHVHNAPAVLGNAYQQVVQQAAVMAYADCQWALGALTFFLLPLVFVLPKRRKDAVKIDLPAE